MTIAVCFVLYEKNPPWEKSRVGSADPRRVDRVMLWEERVTAALDHVK